MRILIWLPLMMLLLHAPEGSLTNPPRDARPLVWWHWMNGNISKDGIRKDLEWMDRAGIVGFHNFDANMNTPQVVEKRLIYMTPEWKDAFNYALDIADSLGMEVSITSSPGWSITGGPWVSEADAEKKLVWSELIVSGGRSIEEHLPEPPQCCGPFQNIPLYPDDPFKYKHFEDICVLAVRIPESIPQQPVPAISTGQDWIEFEYPSPQRMQSLFMVESSLTPVCLEVMRSPEGEFETLIEEIPFTRHRSTSIRTFSFTPTEGIRFRIRATVPGKTLHISEAALSPEPRINLAEDKAGFLPFYKVYDYYPTPDVPDVASLEDVIDISRFVQDGVLRWNAPAGRWRVYRFGWNLLGNRNGPASPEATGLEVDKLDAGCVRRYYDNYLGMYNEATGGRLGTSIKDLMIDSYESGKCTWTLSMEKEFRKRRGYSLRPWLPVLTGCILESAEKSEQFLFDWRITLGELISENHYNIVDDILHEYGMFRYSESHEWRKAFVGDGMMPKKGAKVPMATMWIHYTDDGLHSTYPAGEADIRESSSIAHIYGQNICAAESFTVDGRIGERNGMGAYQSMPCNLKALADGMMAEGVNRFVIHSSVHQPVDDKVPGLGLGPFGQWFNRHDTWAEEARCWTDYLSRSCHLLQMGRWAADIAYFYGEDKNVTGIFVDRRIAAPDGYSYDLVNADILLNELKLKHNTLVSPAGACYKVLMLDKDVKYISFPMLKRLSRIARAGVIIRGPRPVGKAGLRGSQRRFDRLVSRIWSRPNVMESGDLPFEKDVDLGRDRGPDMRFVHRHIDNGELYWISNIDTAAREASVSFRISGFEPELWHADTGVLEPASYRIENGRTVVSLSFVPDDAIFILFRKRTDAMSKEYEKPRFKELQTIEGPWKTRFQPDRGAPEIVVAKQLKSYTAFPEEGIRFFSGTAVYEKGFTVANIPPSADLFLDMGEVHSMARVFLNGRDLGICWKEPYIIPLGSALQKGDNHLTIKVINSWANRLIGDERKAPQDRITFTPERFYTENDVPIPAGLLGPVAIKFAFVEPCD